MQAKEIYKTLDLEIYDTDLLFNLCEKLIKNGDTLFLQGKHIGNSRSSGAIDYYNEAKEICKSLDAEVFNTDSILTDINKKISRSFNYVTLNQAKKYEKEAYKFLLHGWYNGALQNYEKAKATYENIDKDYYDAEIEIRKCNEKIKELEINIRN